MDIIIGDYRLPIAVKFMFTANEATRVDLQPVLTDYKEQNIRVVVSRNYSLRRHVAGTVELTRDGIARWYPAIPDREKCSPFDLMRFGVWTKSKHGPRMEVDWQDEIRVGFAQKDCVVMLVTTRSKQYLHLEDKNGKREIRL